MRAFQTIYVFLICVITIGAQQKNVPLQESKINKKTAFVSMYNKINVLVQTKQWKELNRYVHPEYGFYVLDNPGVRPVPTNLRRFDDLTDNDGNKNEAIVLKLSKLKADRKRKLNFSSIPVWDCGTDQWSKKGSYCENISTYAGLAEHMLYSPVCNENESCPAVVQAKRFGTFITMHVVQSYGYEMYFAYMEGKWYIAVIDLCDKCSA